MNVGEICSRDVDMVELDESVQAAARRMREREVGSLVAVDARQRPRGIVTDRDLTVRALANAADPAALLVRDVITSLVLTIQAEASVEDAMVRMTAAEHRRLVVVDRDERLIGIVSLDDLLEVLSDQLHHIADLLKGEAPHRLESDAKASA